ncbi:unnamed protein product [Mytilus coruscus]|uniref:Uncharacterized protein n=1 Tax=Mytilus coruscus TaxID=42192 RepID=A0A6J8DLG2_MYTCO|nr:unnamed protein product [Mytilus coruscus]
MEKYLYEHLVTTVGTEIHIRNRQRLFIIIDMIKNTESTYSTHISSGSLAEGLELPGSDLDIMNVIDDVDVLQNERNIKYPIHCTTLIMETDIDHPGFTRLRLVAKDNGESILVLCAGERYYLSVSSFIDNYKKMYTNMPVFLHGPCLSDEDQTHDIAFCLWRKITPDNNELLLSVIDSIKFDGIDGLMNNIFPPDNKHYRLLCSNSEHSLIILDFLFYRICSLLPPSDISHCYKVQTFIESLLKSESSSFIIGVCKYKYAIINHYAAQLLPSLTTTTTTAKYNIHKLYHSHLQVGLKTDAVSGWLLYASFYYVTKQYNVTLRLLDYVLSKCTPNTVVVDRVTSTNEDLGFGNYDARYISMYRQSVNSKMSLNDRMKIAVLSNIRFLQHSSLIPEELQLEVNDRDLDIHRSCRVVLLSKIFMLSSYW